MVLNEMKKIADAKTKGEWKNLGTASSEDGDIFMGSGIEVKVNLFLNDDCTNEDEAMELAEEQAKLDSEFIAMAANNWDKLMAVVEAAKESFYELDCNESSYTGKHIDPCVKCDLEKALKALEGE